MPWEALAFLMEKLWPKTWDCLSLQGLIFCWIGEKANTKAGLRLWSHFPCAQHFGSWSLWGAHLQWPARRQGCAEFHPWLLQLDATVAQSTAAEGKILSLPSLLAVCQAHSELEAAKLAHRQEQELDRFRSLSAGKGQDSRGVRAVKEWERESIKYWKKNQLGLWFWIRI